MSTSEIHTLHLSPEGTTELGTQGRWFETWDAFCRSVLCFVEIHGRFDGVEDLRQQQIRDTVELIASVIRDVGWKGFVALLAIMAAGGTAMFVGGLNLWSPVGWVAMGAGGLTTAVTAAVLGRQGWLLYKDRDRVELVKSILEKHREDFERLLEHHPSVQMDNLFRECVQTLCRELHRHAILEEDVSLPSRPICLCGQELLPAHADCYQGTQFSHVICDACERDVPHKEDVFHCPALQVPIHPAGYDVCLSCARALCGRLCKFHALIIQSEDMGSCEDAGQLKSLFEALHFHHIEVLVGRECTSVNVRERLKQLSKCQVNDTIVICYVGHGSVQGGNFWFNFSKSDHFSDKDMMQMLTPTGNAGKHDVLLLLSSCHSGGFGEHVAQNADAEQLNIAMMQALASQSQEFQDDVREHVRQYQLTVRSVAVIAAVQKNNTSSLLPADCNAREVPFTPMMRFVCDAFECCGDDIDPEKLFKFISQRSESPVLYSTGEQFFESVALLNDGDGVPNVPFEQGDFAKRFPLRPALKPYAHYGS